MFGLRVSDLMFNCFVVCRRFGKLQFYRAILVRIGVIQRPQGIILFDQFRTLNDASAIGTMQITLIFP